MGLTADRTANAGLRVHDEAGLVAEIRDLRLVLARFRPGGRPMITAEVPLPLFWMQYANHEDPERNAGSNGLVRILEAASDRIAIECTGSTASGACASTVQLSILRTEPPVRYRYNVKARLEVLDEWPVTPNPDHGEIEFANLWPGGTFVKNPAEKKTFQSCFVVTKNETLRIPHHHLESSDKKNIPLLPGDRFLWGVEDENPCVMIEAGEPVSAGVCAYMWDAHFAFKIAAGHAPVVIPRGAHFEAEYALFGMDRAETESLSAWARARPSGPAGPLYVDGMNSFSVSATLPDVAPADAWPWEQEGTSGAELTLDRTMGYDDTFSLHIRSTGRGKSLWKATAFGPDFGKEPFPRGTRFRLTARIMGRALEGLATIALRLHREGKSGLYQPETYELFTSPRSVHGSCAWELLEVLTPPISPPPDRLHLLLVQEGAGESWFDNVLFEVFL